MAYSTNPYLLKARAAAMRLLVVDQLLQTPAGMSQRGRTNTSILHINTICVIIKK